MNDQLLNNAVATTEAGKFIRILSSVSMYASSDNHVYSLQSGWTLCGYNIVDGVVLRTDTVWMTDRDPHLLCFNLTKHFCRSHERSTTVQCTRNDTSG